MQVIEDAWQHEEFPRPTVATVGNFDGIHRGQRAVIEKVRERAEATAQRSVVVTFEPHPLSILRPERPLQRLTTPEQKRELIRRLEVDLLAIIHFTPNFAATSASDFVEQFLHRKLAVSELWVGSRFAFGHRREGDLGLLRRLAAERGFQARGIDELCSRREIISSTRIRQAIRDGEVGRAAELLGRCYAVSGTVVRGDGRGKTQGWPTINLEPDHDLLPADGVYASRVWLPRHRLAAAAVANVGRRPTFPDGDRRVVEAHLFDFELEVYGERVELGFAERLRGERRFPSVERLVAQIALDAEKAREYLRRQDCCAVVPTLDGK